MPQIRRATAEDADGCVAVLAALPDYFTPDTHDDARREIASERAWVAAANDGTIEGFVIATTRYPASAEITTAAVYPTLRRQGIGTKLISRALDDLSNDGMVVVEVKTLDASSGYEPYVATRAFWEKQGFVQIDCIDPLPGWQPGNPSAIYVAALRPTLGTTP